MPDLELILTDCQDLSPGSGQPTARCGRRAVTTSNWRPGSSTRSVPRDGPPALAL